MSTWSIFAILSFICFCLYEPVTGVHVFDVYRMFQMEKAGSPLGSQRVSVNALATSATRRGSLARNLVILPFSDVSGEKIEDAISNRNAAALLILLPPLHGTEQTITDKDIKRWRRIESELVTKSYTIPIYFSWEDAELRGIYDEVVRVSEFAGVEGETGTANLFNELFGSLSAADQYQFIVPGPEASPVKDVSVTNIQGWIAGSHGEEEPRTIAVVAYYDSFAVAPELALGADSAASGVVALLELARLFSKLYSNPRTQGKYNLLFLLTGAGTVNFAGTKQWLTNTDVRLLEKIDFALCLDAIGSGENLYLHSSKVLPKDESGIYEGFVKTAAQMNIKLESVHKKINISNTDVDWEHEQFSRKRVVSATLSHRSSPPPPFSRSHIYDVEGRVNSDTLIRNIQFVAESLAKIIFGFQKNDQLQVFEGSLAVNKPFVEYWVDFLTSSSRATSLTPKKSPTVVGLEKAIRNYVGDVTNQTFPLESEFVFYDSTKSSISTYRVKPVMFDILLALALIVYFMALYALLKGPTESLKDLQKLISGKSKKSVINKKKQS